jgi:hypothetical protein
MIIDPETFDGHFGRPLLQKNKQVLTSPLVDALYSSSFRANPMPVAMAMKNFYRQAGTLISGWSQIGEQLSRPDAKVRQFSPRRALRAKLTATDHQACVVLGDPTVALPKPA